MITEAQREFVKLNADFHAVNSRNLAIVANIRLDRPQSELEMRNAWEGISSICRNLSSQTVTNHDVSAPERAYFSRLATLFAPEFGLPERLGALREIVDVHCFIAASFELALGGTHFPTMNDNERALSSIANHGLPYLDYAPLSDAAATDLATNSLLDANCLRLAKAWISFFVRNCHPISTPLVPLSLNLISGREPKFKRGRKRSATYLRDITIKAVAEISLANFNRHLDRNPATVEMSISAIIAEVLSQHRQGISEAAVSKIARRPWASFDLAGIPVGKIAEKLFPTTI